MPFDRSLRCKKDYPGFGGSVTTLKVLYNYDSDQYQCKNTSKAVSRFPNAKKSIADDLPRLQGASGLRRRSFVGSNRQWPFLFGRNLHAIASASRRPVALGVAADAQSASKLHIL